MPNRYEWSVPGSMDVPVATSPTINNFHPAPVIDGDYLVTDLNTDQTYSVIVENERIVDIQDFM